jgi:hypothetical protein
MKLPFFPSIFQTFQSSEVLNVPIHAAEGSSGGAAIGATRYYRLKDGRGYALLLCKYDAKT